MKYYGEMTEGVQMLAENLEADICHANLHIPIPVKQAMQHLAKELHRLTPLVESIDRYMLGRDEVDDVIYSLRRTINAVNDHAHQHH